MYVCMYVCMCTHTSIYERKKTLINICKRIDSHKHTYIY